MPVHFDLEYLDRSGPQFSRRQMSILKDKYRKQAFDLVIAIGAPSLEFAEASRSELFPHAAILFVLAGSDGTAASLNPKSDATGVIRKLNYLPSLQLALRQNPGTRHVVVVCGSSDFEKAELASAREQFHAYASNLDFQFWTDLKFAEFESRLANLEPDTVVLFLDFMEDSKGQHFTPSRVLRTFSQTASRPVYGTFASFVGSGAVGGSVADLREVGKVLGQSAVLVLKGAKPKSIPVTTGEFQRPMFDWRQLQRWKIPSDQLPPGSAVLNWEHSAWELYGWQIVGFVAVMVAQALLILLLLASRAKQKRTAQELKKSEEKFSKAFRQGPMAVTLTDAKTHRYIEVNETFERLSGYSRDEVIGRTVFEMGLWEEPSRLEDGAKTVLSEGRMHDVEFRFRRKNGEMREAQASAELIEVDGEPCILGVAIDVTERKQAEQAQKESESRFRLMSDSAPVLMWMSGPDKLCTDFNQEWLRFTGRTLQQELGDGWAEGVHPADRQLCGEQYVAAFDARQDFSIEYRLRRHDGQYRWVLDRGVPRFLEDGGFAGYIGCCIDITEEKAAKAAQAEFSGRLIAAQEEERARIARELHDDINQRLALLANGLGELQRSPHPYNGRLTDLWQLTSDIAADIQRMSHQLHPSKLHYLGLAAAMRDLCQEFSKLNKMDVECIVRILPGELEQRASLTLFRILQESLRNVAKHSQAQHVKVELTRESNLARLRVSDDGIGFDMGRTKPNGLGLVSMRERLRLVDGTFSIWSRPSLGTQVEATVALKAQPTGHAAKKAESATASHAPASSKLQS